MAKFAPEPFAASLPLPEHSGIEHVVVVMMENRSFDHFLGWLPNADGKQAGLSYVDQTGAIHYTNHLAGDFTGCGHVQPDHSYQGGRIQYDAGKMDGFLRSGNDTFSIGYYEEKDLTFFGAMARRYTSLDRYFCSFLGPTVPNRFFLLQRRQIELVTLWTYVSWGPFGTGSQRLGLAVSATRSS